MREHDICRLFMAAKCRKGRGQEVGCRVVVNDENVCIGANESKVGHIRKNRDQGVTARRGKNVEQIVDSNSKQYAEVAGLLNTGRRQQDIVLHRIAF